VKTKKRSCLVAEWHAGKPGAPAVLLLHGFGANHHWWKRMIDSLTQDYQVYALDLRFRQALPSIAEELLEWTHQKRLAHVRVLGHSLGALLGMYCAARAPQMVERLILINPAIALPVDTPLSAGTHHQPLSTPNRHMVPLSVSPDLSSRPKEPASPTDHRPCCPPNARALGEP
jgi:pimeloyl-ACP methyl ester carboxylesterase